MCIQVGFSLDVLQRSSDFGSAFMEYYVNMQVFIV